jgi:NitT/TauT family transport system ATP-binding protein
MIDVQRVSHSFEDLRVLQEITFSVARGEFVSFLGPSGCGKSTLLKILGGLIKPSFGEVHIDGHVVNGSLRRGNMGFVFQRPVLLPWRTVRQNVELPLELLDHQTVGQRSPSEVLRDLGIAEFENAMPKELSGGMQHRVALARALVFQPEILLMDEPFTGLDELLRERLDIEVLRLTEQLRQTVILVTHSVPEAVLLSDRVIVLSKRPARIRAIIPVDLGRPRDQERRSPRHLELIEQIRGILRS